jgi:(1->4)-alpha-D-glucan 1-alpha-D-glucosylmutase
VNASELIEPYYYSYWGDRVETSEATRRALLEAMGGAAICHPERDDRVTLSLSKGDTEEQSRCYLPRSMRNGKIWALATQLYALRSTRNWGIGDFTDLAFFAQLAGRAGARAVGLNPLHALHPSNPAAASPYSPSSRLFLNALYIDVERVPELAESPETETAIRGADFQSRLERLRALALVDYPGVAAAKFEMLERLHRVFRTNHDRRPFDQRARTFRRFVRSRGISLERLAVYEALAEFFRARDASYYGWQQWPSEYRSPDSPAVARFPEEHRERVDFYLYLQWLAHEQLAAAEAVALATGVRLYCDLAVGVDANGADAWAYPSVFLSGVSLGAPGDPLNTHGQNWGLAPLSPPALQERAFEPFVALLRANMRYAGILRIDHVMALRRAFWIPRGAAATEGAYVTYPMEELLEILARESKRDRCAVIGEDLGTVPEGFRERMQAVRALSSRLFYFERDWSDGTFLPPERYPRLAAASIGTHDLPTLAGWWTGDRSAGENRERDRFLLVDALEHAGAIDETGAARSRDDARRGGTPAVFPELAFAAHRFLALTPAMLAVVSIDDVLGEEQAVNVPGTFDEHPNWRRKLSLPLESIEADGRLAKTGTMMNTR